MTERQLVDFHYQTEKREGIAMLENSRIPAKLVSTSETEDDDGDDKDRGADDQEKGTALARLAGYRPAEGVLVPPPMKMPPFTLKELRAAVPKHCFERSLVTSTSYLGRDLFITGGLFYMASQYNFSNPTTFSQALFWPVYWIVQGTCLGALWVLGHECGHHAFSVYGWINDLVGFVLHSTLLVPYFTWKITHRQHHSKVNSMELDTVFVPMTRTEYTTWQEVVEDNLEDAPLYNLYRGLSIIREATSQLFAKVDSLFNPENVRFTQHEGYLVFLSNLGVGMALSISGLLTWTLSVAVMARVVFMPYIVLNVYIVTIAMLQHTDTFIPRFRSASWKWLHASLCTVDRDLGVFLNEVLHHAADTHVCHHIFPMVPFYHAVEATRALRPLLGRYYLKDDTPIVQAFWRSYTHCKFVEDDGSIVFCKKSL